MVITEQSKKRCLVKKETRIGKCECGQITLIYDYERGEIYCPKCGLVHAENLIHGLYFTPQTPIRIYEKEIPKTTCEICGHKFRYKPRWNFNRLDFSNDYCDFCSNIIKWTHSRYGEQKTRNKNWKGGKSFEPYCEKFNEEFKERVREYWENKCGICGVEEKYQTRKLSVHHISYKKDDCCSNNDPIFVPLCTSCHAKTNFNRRYWEKMLSNYIMIYFNGESYLPY